MNLLKTIQEHLPKTLQAKYTKNFQSFDTWNSHNRIHQKESLLELSKTNLGQISLPTGTGKTRVQISAHVSQMIENDKQNIFGVHVIGAHRLALCNQLLNEILPVIVNAGLNFDILFVGSERFPEDKVFSKFKDSGLNAYLTNATATTRQDEITKAYENSQKNNRHLIAVSTYHSFNRLKIIPRINICTYDEAHTLVGSLEQQFLENVKEVFPQIDRNYFFTATRKIQGDIGGMNQKKIFGEVLYEKSPREMINALEIVPPKFHMIDTKEDGDYNNETMLVKTIIQGFQEHKKKIKLDSSNPYNIGAKLLITTTGNKELTEIYTNDIFKSYCIENNVHVFSYSSEHGSFHNFQKKNRNDVMEAMQNLEDSQDAVLLHIDILTEGIDLPSITGIMPFRELNKIKLLQSLGRASRLLKIDRQNVYANIFGKGSAKFIKPYCWILLPRFFKSLGDSNSMKEIIKTIVNVYEVPVEEYSVIDQYKDYSESDLKRITEIDKANKNDKETDLVNIFEDIVVENFYSEISSENKSESILEIFKKASL